MKTIIQFFGVLLIFVGIAFLINAELVYNWAEEHIGNKTAYISIIVGRLVIGILLILAAKESRYPGVIKFIGYLAIMAALLLIVLGHNGFQDLITSLIPKFRPYAPISGLMGLAFGGLFIYAFSKKKESKENSN